MAAELLAIDQVRRALKDLSSIPASLRRWISGAIEDVGVGLGNVGELKIRLRQAIDDHQCWPELAEQMLGTLRSLPQRVVLILDEFPIMIANMLDRDAAAALRFLRWFRTFRQSPGTERLTFLLGGSTNIEPRLELLKTEAVLGDLQRFRIMPFPHPKALQFLKELLEEEKADYESGLPEKIIETCQSGVPYYLQTIISEFLAESRRSGTPLLVADLPTIYLERVIGPLNRHRFSHYHTRLKLHYDELEQPARVILAKLCAGTKSLGELSSALDLAGYDSNWLERVLVLLEGDYYIVRDGKQVSFSDGLLSDWWSRNSTPPKVKS
jgi:hypothetical protein